MRYRDSRNNYALDEILALYFPEAPPNSAAAYGGPLAALQSLTTFQSSNSKKCSFSSSFFLSPFLLDSGQKPKSAFPETLGFLILPLKLPPLSAIHLFSDHHRACWPSWTLTLKGVAFYPPLFLHLPPPKSCRDYRSPALFSF